MPQPERTYRHVDTTRSPHTIASMEQFLRSGTARESSRMSPTYSPTSSSPSSPYFERIKNQDPEEDQGLYQKKSVLAKMKEKAKKFRNSLNKKKQEDGNLTPSWGVSLEDDEEEEDAEYLGAPMYESELAPEGYKENARQHPRANPVISEKHVLHVNKSNTTTQPATSGSNKTMTETIAEKLTPIFGGGSNEANSTSSKTNADSTTLNANNMSSQTSSIAPPTSSSVPSPKQNSSSSSSAPSSGKNTNPNQKGPTVKDYLMNKVETREDEKTMSPQPKVISEATSPGRTTPSDNAGVMDKVKGAVNSLLGNEEPSQQYAVKTTPASTTTTTSRSSSQTQQVGQEENHGRILQAN